MKKVLAVIDVQQLFLASRKEYGPLARVDYLALHRAFNPTHDPDTVIDAIAYVVVSPKHEDYKFIRFLKKVGFKVMRQFAGMAPIDEGSSNEMGVKIIPKSWTHKMIRDLHSFVSDNTYDEYYIVSGSGGFISAVNAIHAQGKKAIVMGFRSSIQGKLIESADQTIILDNTILYDENLYKRPPQEVPNESGSTE